MGNVAFADPPLEEEEVEYYSQMGRVSISGKRAEKFTVCGNAALPARFPRRTYVSLRGQDMDLLTSGNLFTIEEKIFTNIPSEDYIQALLLETRDGRRLFVRALVTYNVVTEKWDLILHMRPLPPKG